MTCPRSIYPAAGALGATDGARGETALPRWKVGAVVLGVSEQADPRVDQRVTCGLALPFVIYRGDVLRIDRETLGPRAMKPAAYELDLGFGAVLGSRSRDSVAGAANADGAFVCGRTDFTAGASVAWTWKHSATRGAE